MNVLIVDNSTLFHEMLVGIFTNSDMTPVICDNAEQALAALNSQQFDFICVSMFLEDSDGIALTKIIRSTSAHKHTPLFYLLQKSQTKFMLMPYHQA